MVPPSMSEMDWTCGASLSAHAYHKLFGTGDEKECAKFAEIEAPNAPISKWHDVPELLEALTLIRKTGNQSAEPGILTLLADTQRRSAPGLCPRSQRLCG